jgi:hypothetical protein
MKKISEKAIKGIAIGASVIGAVATLASNWAGEQKQKSEIAKAVAEHFAKTSDKES